jgi:hypothetical protein
VAILDGVPVSDRDKQRMAALAASLSAVETDTPAPAEALDVAVAAADADRRGADRTPLRRDELVPEEGFYARARALGLRRLRG